MKKVKDSIPLTLDFERGWGRGLRKDVIELFKNLQNNISQVGKTESGEWEKMQPAAFKLKEYLAKGKVGKITFHGSGGPHDVTDDMMIWLITKAIQHGVTTNSIIKKPSSGRPKSNLSRLLSISDKLIFQLKRRRISDDLLVQFITQSATHPDGTSVVEIKSVPAFTKAFKRTK